ncbi:MAG TPA: glutathione-dependent formaldehyde dehydrogenase [Myxococcales bacterium]|nr:glutathione-dependent formaldehyde dehydrogenase [Myxococcales bacterium]
MKAIVYRGIGDIRIEDVPEPQLQDPEDAIVRLTATAICGTDLHMVRGTVPGMRPGTILGHEGAGVVEDLGEDVRNFDIGDRVVICPTIACGVCSYCRYGYFSQCDRANPNGPLAGSAYFGGPESSGAFHGLQAERARIPFAHTTMVKLPDEVSDDQAILLSDIFPTGYFGAVLADIKPGRTVAIFGCGPVGQFAIAGAKLVDAGRIIAVDTVESRLDMARAQGAETVNFNEEQPVEAIRRLTGGIGVDRVIDAVGVDAVRAHSGPAAGDGAAREIFQAELQELVPQPHPVGDNWHPGDAPSQALEWAVDAVAKGGRVAIIGVYPQTARRFPIGLAMDKNLTVKAGNCNHRKYIPLLIEKVVSGEVDPTKVLTQLEPLTSGVDAYRAFDTRQSRWMKVELQPGI